jgi:hypothetical protein
MEQTALTKLKEATALGETLLPPFLYRALLKLAGRMSYMAYSRKDLLGQNVDLKGRGRGRRAFLLATGPSLKGVNLRALEGEDCFSLSNFILHDDVRAIAPRFHFIASYHPPLVLEEYVRWLRLADERLPPSTGIFLSHRTMDLVQSKDLFSSRTVRYLHMSHADAPFLPVDITRTVMAPQTGPLMILPVLFYMQYETIYLLGCDHTTLRDRNKTITHFYDRNLDPRQNASDGAVWESTLADLKAEKRVHEQYAGYLRAIQRGRLSKVVNLSTDSWLDIFPFDRLDRVLTSGAAGRTGAAAGNEGRSGGAEMQNKRP